LSHHKFRKISGNVSQSNVGGKCLIKQIEREVSDTKYNLG